MSAALLLHRPAKSSAGVRCWLMDDSVGDFRIEHNSIFTSPCDQARKNTQHVHAARTLCASENVYVFVTVQCHVLFARRLEFCHRICCCEK